MSKQSPRKIEVQGTFNNVKRTGGIRNETNGTIVLYTDKAVPGDGKTIQRGADVKTLEKQLKLTAEPDKRELIAVLRHGEKTANEKLSREKLLEMVNEDSRFSIKPSEDAIKNVKDEFTKCKAEFAKIPKALEDFKTFKKQQEKELRDAKRKLKDAKTAYVKPAFVSLSDRDRGYLKDVDDSINSVGGGAGAGAGAGRGASSSSLSPSSSSSPTDAEERPAKKPKTAA